MDERRPVDETCISYHVVTRYIQRIVGIDVDDAGPYADERKRAFAHTAAAGTTIDAVRRKIWSPGLAKAVELGFQRVTCGDLVFRIVQPERVIATVHPKKERLKRRFKIMSRNEVRARTKRTERKMKRKPVFRGD